MRRHWFEPNGEGSPEVGARNVGRLLALADKATLPEAAHQSIRSLADQFRDTQTRIEEITAMVEADAQGHPMATRLQI